MTHLTLAAHEDARTTREKGREREREREKRGRRRRTTREGSEGEGRVGKERGR